VRLELLTPPVLVTVDDGGTPRPSLLLARRGRRSYVCVSRGPGSNHLRWVDAAEVGPPQEWVGGLVRASAAGCSVPSTGLPRTLR